MEEMILRCEAIKADGERCSLAGGNVDPASRRCFWHDPARQAEARKARRLGGQITAQRRKDRKTGVRSVLPEDAPPPPETVEDCVRWTSWTIHAVTVGWIDPRTAREIGYNLKTLLTGLEKVTEKQEFESVKAQIAELQKGSIKRVK